MTTYMKPEPAELMKLFGVQYYAPGEKAIVTAQPNDLYEYAAYLGPQTLKVEAGDSAVFLHGDEAVWVRGTGQNLDSEKFAVVVRGYKPSPRRIQITKATCLPYVNGCSTRQLFPPERLGDPTLQLLDIPPFSAEQAHHIHSTVRVVHILAGRGVSIVGMDNGTIEEELVPGKNLVLHPMCPHHFATPQGEHLICVPFHVFSSVGGLENNHPMFNGTHLMNQG